MGRKPLSEHPPEVAAKMRADLAEKKRQAWRDRQKNGYGSRETGTLRQDVRDKISASVKSAWDNGQYADRENGMAGVTGADHPNWTWGRNHFREVLTQFEGAPSCHFCGTTEDETKIDVHHIDESHDNYLLSNLIFACVSCHHWRFHYDKSGTNRLRLPFITLSKKFHFEYAHVLPWHPGKCSRLHGHSGLLEVSIRARVDPNGVVEDYADIGAIVKMAIVEKYDHTFLNDVLENPTSENFLVHAWFELERAGLKGLTQIEFQETGSSTSTLTKADMLEAFGWDRIDGLFVLVPRIVPVKDEEMQAWLRNPQA